MDLVIKFNLSQFSEKGEGELQKQTFKTQQEGVSSSIGLGQDQEYNSMQMSSPEDDESP